MKKYFQTLIIIVCSILYVSALAGQVRQLKWEDLVPRHLLFEDHLANLTQDQKDLVFWVINTLEILPKRGPESEEYYIEVDKAMPELIEAGVDIDELMAKRNEIQTAIVEELVLITNNIKQKPDCLCTSACPVKRAASLTGVALGEKFLN